MYYFHRYNDQSLGALAQLVERNNGIVEVSGSIPLRSMQFILISILHEIPTLLFHHKEVREAH